MTEEEIQQLKDAVDANDQRASELEDALATTANSMATYKALYDALTTHKKRIKRKDNVLITVPETLSTGLLGKVVEVKGKVFSVDIDGEISKWYENEMAWVNKDISFEFGKKLKKSLK